MLKKWRKLVTISYISGIQLWIIVLNYVRLKQGCPIFAYFLFSLGSETICFFASFICQIYSRNSLNFAFNYSFSLKAKNYMKSFIKYQFLT